MPLFFSVFSCSGPSVDESKDTERVVSDSDSVVASTLEPSVTDSTYINHLTADQLDSLEFRLTHHYTINDNFIVTADSIRLVPRYDETNDTCYVYKNDMLVVVKIKRKYSGDRVDETLSQADVDLVKSMEEAVLDVEESFGDTSVVAMTPSDTLSTDTVWLKVAGGQLTMGWITESMLLGHTVPNDNISLLLNSLTNTRLLWMGGLLLFGLIGFSLHNRYNRAGRGAIVKMDEMDSAYPFLFIGLVAFLACLYASIQNFAPEFWQEYYFHPTLNPFMLPGVMAVLVCTVWLLLIVFIALITEIYNNFHLGRGIVYFLEIMGASMLTYLFISWTTLIYIGYLFFLVLVGFLWMFYVGYVKCKYICGNCGRKIRDKGKCPYCGTENV